jgi:hypothetical protein
MNEANQLINGFISDLFEFLSKYLLDKDENSKVVEKDDCIDLVIKNESYNSELTITSDGGELTVFFDSYHTHFNLVKSGAIDPEDTKEVLKLVSGILSGETMVLDRFKDEKWIGGEIIENNFGKYQDKVLEDLADCDYVQLKSWTEETKRIDANNMG